MLNQAGLEEAKIKIPPRRPFRWSLLVLAAVVIAIIWRSQNDSKVAVEPFFDASNLQQAGHFLASVWPPELDSDYLWKVAGLAVGTLEIAIAGTALGLVLAFPLSLLAMRLRGEEMSRVAQGTPRWLLRWVGYYFSRTLLNIGRAVPELVWALLAIVFVGLGPFAGVVALTLHTTGSLGKIYAETFEAVDQRLVETLRNSGARESQVLFLGRIPLTLPSLVSSTLFRWEENMRAATILGFVAAGGLGNELILQMKIYQYDKVATDVIALLILVTLVDISGQFLRSRLLDVSGQSRRRWSLAWLTARHRAI